MNKYWFWTLHLFYQDLFTSTSHLINTIKYLISTPLYFKEERGSLNPKNLYSYKSRKYFFSIYSKTTSKKNWQDQKSQILWGLFSIPNLSFYYNINKFYSFINRFEFNKILTAYSQFCLNIAFYCLRRYKTVVKEGLLYIRSIFIICFVDAVFTDDEPLWEPVEWSLVMSWILFIFIFAWAAENLITSRYGSYTGRDKRVWFGWFKTFWLLNSWFAVSYGIAAMFVILPFYSELVYPISFTFSWWNWYNRVFFYKFVSLYSIMLLLALLIQLNLRWLNWKKLIFFCICVNVILAFLLYTHTVMTFFAYFTDPLWYQKTKIVDYVQLSHEPWKWGWGPAKRDHFSYHKVSTVFWFKNDGPYASAFLLIQSLFFISLVLLYTYWLILLRRIYSTKEFSLTFLVYCTSALRQFFLCFSLFYVCIFLSFALNYSRAPIEFAWLMNKQTWGNHFFVVFFDYTHWLLSFFYNVICYLLKPQKYFHLVLFSCLWWVALLLLV